jgi:hypothetical protein
MWCCLSKPSVIYPTLVQSLIPNLTPKLTPVAIPLIAANPALAPALIPLIAANPALANFLQSSEYILNRPEILSIGL